MSKTVVIVDDSAFTRASLRDTLESNGYTILGEAHNGEQGIDLVMEKNPDVITLDNILPDMTGFDILKALKSFNCQSKIIMVSAVGQSQVKKTAKELGAHYYLVKPIKNEALIEIMEKI